MLAQIHDFQDKKKVKNSDIDVSLISECKPNKKVISEHLVKMKMYSRRPTAHTKTRAMISATTAKPHNQKGTGNARQGTTVGAQHVGGVKIFGPLGIKRKISLPKNEVKLVKRMILKIALDEGKLLFINDCRINTHKTKESVSIANSFSNGKVFIICLDSELEKNNILSSRNTHRISYGSISSFTVNNLVSSDCILVTESVLPGLIDLLS